MLKAMTSDSKSLPDAMAANPKWEVRYILSGRLHLTIKHTGIHNMAKSGGRKARPQGCSRRSHRLRRPGEDPSITPRRSGLVRFDFNMQCGAAFIVGALFRRNRRHLRCRAVPTPCIHSIKV